jgi:hypothetical protein
MQCRHLLIGAFLVAGTRSESITEGGRDAATDRVIALALKVDEGLFRRCIARLTVAGEGTGSDEQDEGGFQSDPLELPNMPHQESPFSSSPRRAY